MVFSTAHCSPPTRQWRFNSTVAVTAEGFEAETTEFQTRTATVTTSIPRASLIETATKEVESSDQRVRM